MFGSLYKIIYFLELPYFDQIKSVFIPVYNDTRKTKVKKFLYQGFWLVEMVTLFMPYFTSS